MAASFVASALGNDGQTADTTSFTITIPATAAIGDVAVAVIQSTSTTSTFTTPTGWTKSRGPDTTTGSCSSVLYNKTLVSGDPGATVTFTQTVTGRFIGAMLVFRGVTTSGIGFNARVAEASTTSPVLSGLNPVTAGSAFISVMTAHSATVAPAPTATYGTGGYTTVAAATTAYAASPQIMCFPAYKITATSGLVGNETESFSTACDGTNYAVALPQGVGATAAGAISLGGSATFSAAATGALTLTGSVSGQSAPTATGAVTVSATAAGVGAAAAAGTVTLSGSASPAGSLPATAAGTLNLDGAGAAAGSATSGGAVTIGGDAVGAPAAAAVGSLTLSGNGAAAAGATTTGVITLGGTPTAAVAATAAGATQLNALANATAGYAPSSAGPSETLTVGADPRTFTFGAEIRTLAVPPEIRATAY